MAQSGTVSLSTSATTCNLHTPGAGVQQVTRRLKTGTSAVTAPPKWRALRAPLLFPSHSRRSGAFRAGGRRFPLSPWLSSRHSGAEGARLRAGGSFPKVPSPTPCLRYEVHGLIWDYTPPPPPVPSWPLYPSPLNQNFRRQGARE